jgi:carnitine O-acetyltransferase
VAKSALGVLSTENRKAWSSLRDQISLDKNNASCLQIVDDALFVVCLDDSTPETMAEVCNDFLCGTYELRDGIQVGSCTNRWYDKVSASSSSGGGLLNMIVVASTHYLR